MQRNKLFNALVVGGAALTIGPVACGCSSSAAPTRSPDDAKPQDDTASSADTGGGTSNDGTSNDSAEMPDDGAPIDTSDGGLRPCSEICKDGWCEGMCCMWGAKHRCCADAG